MLKTRSVLIALQRYTAHRLQRVAKRLNKHISYRPNKKHYPENSWYVFSVNLCRLSSSNLWLLVHDEFPLKESRNWWNVIESTNPTIVDIELVHLVHVTNPIVRGGCWRRLTHWGANHENRWRHNCCCCLYLNCFQSPIHYHQSWQAASNTGVAVGCWTCDPTSLKSWSQKCYRWWCL